MLGMGQTPKRKTQTEMKTFLERQHRQRIQSDGWDAQISDFHSNGCAFRFCGRNYSLIRSGNGFIIRCDGESIWPEPTYPDAALAHVWRHSRFTRAKAIIEHIRKS
jgi:hypothetical protein